jgi:hypothetical protein
VSDLTLHSRLSLHQIKSCRLWFPGEYLQLENSRVRAHVCFSSSEHRLEAALRPAQLQGTCFPGSLGAHSDSNPINSLAKEPATNQTQRAVSSESGGRKPWTIVAAVAGAGLLLAVALAAPCLLRRKQRAVGTAGVSKATVRPSPHHFGHKMQRLCFAAVFSCCILVPWV